MSEVLDDHVDDLRMFCHAVCFFIRFTVCSSRSILVLKGQASSHRDVPIVGDDVLGTFTTNLNPETILIMLKEFSSE